MLGGFKVVVEFYGALLQVIQGGLHFCSGFRII